MATKIKEKMMNMRTWLAPLAAVRDASLQEEGYGGVIKLRVIAVVLLSLVLIAPRAHAEVNLALGKNVVVSSTYVLPGDIYAASKAVDGDTTTLWNSGGWATSWLEVDLGQTYSLAHVDLYGEGSWGVTYNLYHSLVDDLTWTYIASGALSSSNPMESVNFNGQATRYLKFEGISAGDWVGLEEIQAFAAPDAPPSVVPEPSTLALIAAGALLLPAWLRRRERRAQ